MQGFLLNFCNDNAEATERCGELGFVGVVAANVLSTRTNDAVFNATLNLLVAVAEAPESAGREDDMSSLSSLNSAEILSSL